MRPATDIQHWVSNNTMTRLSLGILAGLGVIILSTAILWIGIPIVLTAVSINPNAWLAWFPFVIFVPSVALGGFIAARFAPTLRFVLGFLVGLAAASLAALLTHFAGQILILLAILFVGGVVGAVGASFASNNAAPN
jgi:hypothetical protein